MAAKPPHLKTLVQVSSRPTIDAEKDRRFVIRPYRDLRLLPYSSLEVTLSALKREHDGVLDTPSSVRLLTMTKKLDPGLTALSADERAAKAYGRTAVAPDV